jgi:outer membrane biosynthesis protein TonB
MASDSVTPPPSGGGSAKYIIVVLLLLAGGLGAYLAMSGKPETPPAPTPTPEPPKVERPTTLGDDQLVIPVEEPEVEDAGTTAAPTKRPVRNNGGGDSWSCEGDISTAEVRRVIADTQSAMRSCYERRLRNDNQLQGSINLQVRVGKDGRVADTRTRGSMRDAEVLRCVQSMAKSWSFPSPTGGSCAVLDVPYNFTPKN